MVHKMLRKMILKQIKHFSYYVTCLHQLVAKKISVSLESTKGDLRPDLVSKFQMHRSKRKGFAPL